MKYASLIALVALCFVATPATHAQDVKARNLVISNPWARATPGGAKVAGGYITITNTGDQPERLMSAESDGAERVEIHEMATTNGVMTMRPLDRGLEIAPGQAVTLAPGGLHLMFMNIKRPLKEGTEVPVSLQFQRAGQVRTVLRVRGIGAQNSGGETSTGGHRHE